MVFVLTSSGAVRAWKTSQAATPNRPTNPSKHCFPNTAKHSQHSQSYLFSAPSPTLRSITIKHNLIMPERRAATSSSSNHTRSTNVRRNLFHQHLSRRPTTSSTSTSAETLRLDNDLEIDSSEIVIRDQNGDFQIGDPPVQAYDDQEEGGNGDAMEDESTSSGI